MLERPWQLGQAVAGRRTAGRSLVSASATACCGAARPHARIRSSGSAKASGASGTVTGWAIIRSFGPPQGGGLVANSPEDRPFSPSAQLTRFWTLLANAEATMAAPVVA